MDREIYNKSVHCLDNLCTISNDIKELDNMLNLLSDENSAAVLKICSNKEEMTIELSKEIGKNAINEMQKVYRNEAMKQRKELTKIIDETILS